MPQNPLLSICCVAYNHEKYIAQALDSFLMQKTDFDFEIVVGNDCSTDLTAAIVNDYAIKHPEKIRLLDFKDNVGYSANTGRTLKECKGKYIAICDSDDYFTDPLKLQKQVNFLEQNSAFGLVYSDFNRLYQSTGNISKNIFQNELGFKADTFEDFLIHAWFLCTNTWVFRRELLSEIDYSQYRVADLVILLDLASKSGVAHLTDSMSVYRILQQSDSQGLNLLQKMKHRKGTYKIQMDFAERLKVNQQVVEQIKKVFISSGNIFWGGCLYNDLEIRSILKEQLANLPMIKRAVYKISTSKLVATILLSLIKLTSKIVSNPVIRVIFPIVKKIKF